MIAVLVNQRFFRQTSPFHHLFRETDHLVDRLSTGQPIDKVHHHSIQFIPGFPGRCFGQDINHHRDHDVPPAFTDQRDGAIEIKYRKSNPAFYDIRIDQFDLCIRKVTH